MEANSNLLVTLTVIEMHDLIRECIREEMQDVQPLKEQGTKYLTRLEVCATLKISLPTLSRYSGLGLIPAKRIGNRILYSQEDIQNAINEIPSGKHNK